MIDVAAHWQLQPNNLGRPMFKVAVYCCTSNILQGLPPLYSSCVTGKAPHLVTKPNIAK